MLPKLPHRSPASHKGDYGRVLLVGGSRGMSGAIALAGMAALRGGAGLVTLATPDVCLDAVASFEPSYMTAPLASDGDGRISAAARPALDALVRTADCVAFGPGLGRSDWLTSLVVDLYRTVDKPMVFDADALNALAVEPTSLRSPGGPRILTPHPGEFQRLVGGGKLDRDAAEKRAVQMAADCGLVVVLKGHRSLVTNGHATYHNTTGNPGMATGGSGDVLTGVLVALLGQKMSPWDAARLGVHVHGLAGDLAANRFGMVSMIARDVIGCLPDAFLQVGS